MRQFQARSDQHDYSILQQVAALVLTILAESNQQVYARGQQGKLLAAVLCYQACTLWYVEMEAGEPKHN